MDAQTIGVLRQFGVVAARRMRVDVPQAMVDTVRGVALTKQPFVDGRRQLSREDVGAYESLCNRMLPTPLSPDMVAQMAAPEYQVGTTVTTPE